MRRQSEIDARRSPAWARGATLTLRAWFNLVRQPHRKESLRDAPAEAERIYEFPCARVAVVQLSHHKHVLEGGLKHHDGGQAHTVGRTHHEAALCSCAVLRKRIVTHVDLDERS